eukprot:40888-Prorocentrum_minimum.AAC.1
MTRLGNVAPPNIEWRLSLLDRAVLDVCPPGSGGSKPLDRGKTVDNRYSVVLLFPTVALRYLIPDKRTDIPDIGKLTCIGSDLASGSANQVEAEQAQLEEEERRQREREMEMRREALDRMRYEQDHLNRMAGSAEQERAARMEQER